MRAGRYATHVLITETQQCTMMKRTPSRGRSRGRHRHRDLLASIVVFLVSLRLCMGIAIASCAPVNAGPITGIVGGPVACSLMVGGGLPAVGAAVLSESEAPLESHPVSHETAIPRSLRHESHGHFRNVNPQRSRRVAGERVNRLLSRPAGVSGHRMANGLCAPLLC